jgi:hypothetical protein
VLAVLVRNGRGCVTSQEQGDQWNPATMQAAGATFGMYRVHALHIHVHKVYIHVHTVYMGTTDYLRIPLPCMPVCTALVICMYYAIVQEYDILYVLGSDRDIPPKNGQGRWVAFL